MSDMTANLALPYILPSQAQKHVTHNEALQTIDAVAQLTVTASLSAPPGSPAEGACYAVIATATGLFAGKEGRLALRVDGSWTFIQPRRGWRAWFVADSRLRVHDGSAWQIFDPVGTPATFGINATADTTNRLTLASDASLFNHAGTGHQVKVNKASAAATASLMFQSGFSGRAEMGLAGTDTFSIKVSPDGSAWAEALAITAQGAVRLPQRPVVRATRGGGVVTPSSGSQTGFATLSVNQGGFTLGASVAGGGNRLVVPVTGAYLVCLGVEANPAGAFTVAVRVNGTTTIASVRDNDAASASYSQTAIGVALLTAGDWLVLEHTGTTPLDFAYNKTELTAMLL